MAKAVTIFGAVTGTIAASDTVDLRGTASVEGNISSPRLAVSDGAVMKGRVEAGIRSKDQPTSR